MLKNRGFAEIVVKTHWIYKHFDLTRILTGNDSSKIQQISKLEWLWIQHFDLAIFFHGKWCVRLHLLAICLHFIAVIFHSFPKEARKSRRKKLIAFSICHDIWAISTQVTQLSINPLTFPTHACLMPHLTIPRCMKIAFRKSSKMQNGFIKGSRLKNETQFVVFIQNT